MHHRMLVRLGLAPFAFLFFLGFSDPSSAATYYNFQQYEGNGVAGAVGNASLQFSNNATTIKANFIKGIGSFADNLVIFVDSAPGGFTSTSMFTNQANPLEIAVSGLSFARSVANFAPGFEADYAIALGVDNGASIYKLVTDSTGAQLVLVKSGLSFVYRDNYNHGTYSFQFDWADIGLPSRNTNFFKFETTYITSTASRTMQSFEGLTGQYGYKTVNFTNYDTYGVPPIPENTSAALAVFGGLFVAGVLGKRIHAHFKSREFRATSPPFPPSS